MRRVLIVFGILISAGLAGCSPHGLNFQPAPDVSYPDTFSLSDEDFAAEFTRPWWENFERESLNKFIGEALDANQDLAAAAARVKQARAISRVTGADRFPSVELQGNSRSEWEGSDKQPSSGDIGAALSWEVDVWGRVGSAALADELEARARQADVEALKLSVSAEVAVAYFGAVAAHQRLALLREQLTLDNDLLELLDLRLENGVGTNVDVLQQRARVADSETLIPRAESDLAVFENRLDVLIGRSPDGAQSVSEQDNLDFADGLPPLGVPAALLMNRPDLRAAKSDLAAADANIAAAIADRFPRITLDASYVYSDSSTYTGPVAMLAGMFVQPLLDWGKRKAEVERNEALYEERLAAFTQLFLEAVEDVENALIREQKQREFVTRLEAQRSILREAVSASEDRYKQGIDDYLPVINSLQELRQVERDLIAERLELVNIRIALFRAIGGPISHAGEGESPDEN